MRAREFISENEPLNELTGYKKDPVYSLLQNSRNMEEFLDALKLAGYQQYVLGSGCFGTAFKRPGEDSIIKLWKDDPAYDTYLSFVLQNQSNPHVPKIIGRPVKLLRRFNLMRMELLDNKKLFTLERKNIRYQIQEYLEVYPYAEETTLFEEFPQLKPVLDFIRSAAGGTVVIDVGTSNILWRKGDIPVITDPIADFEKLRETISTGQGGGSAGIGGGSMVGGPTTYEQEYGQFKTKGPHRITAMTYEDFSSENKITLKQLYSKGLPDHDEMIWNFVGDSDFNVPFTVQTISPVKLELLFKSQYGVDHIDEIYDVLDSDQEDIVDSYRSDPNLSNSIIVMNDGIVVDGHHRALAAILNRKPIKYVDVSQEA